MAIDGKYGRVTLENGSIGEEEPVIVFRAQDKMLLDVLAYYLELCGRNGSPERHLQAIKDTMGKITKWQETNFTQIPKSEGYNGRL